MSHLIIPRMRIKNNMKKSVYEEHRLIGQ